MPTAAEPSDCSATSEAMSDDYTLSFLNLFLSGIVTCEIACETCQHFKKNPIPSAVVEFNVICLCGPQDTILMEGGPGTGQKGDGPEFPRGTNQQDIGGPRNQLTIMGAEKSQGWCRLWDLRELRMQVPVQNVDLMQSSPRVRVSANSSPSLHLLWPTHHAGVW